MYEEVRRLRLSEQLIVKYAKRIYGFAYAKTHHIHNAEDLLQNILLALCDERISEKSIENMDAYVWRVCQYTWSKYLRKNKPQWDTSPDEAALYTLESDDNIEETIIHQELFDRLNREIMYLSRLKREITILFYYDNKKSDEISSMLGIPSSTVRWHLGQAKIDLRERIVMTQANGTFYRPIKLCNGRHGWGRNASDPCWLDSDVLIQNLCWICHGKALTIEEMAQTLGVAAAYLEDKLERLLYMDYFKKVGKNRYQTNFFIPDGDYQPPLT
jgi:RNA polymerase sigma factor (sigma-70 family)